MNILTSLFLFLGSYGAAEDECIKVYSFDETTGVADYVCGCSGISNPSFVYPSEDGVHLYAVGEDEGETATANSLLWNHDAKTLTLTSTSLTHGGAPCNIIQSPGGKHIYTANYFGGSVTEFDLCKDGRLKKGRVIGFEGESIDRERQTKPYLHAVNFTRDGRFMLADDLGTDKVHVFPIIAGKDQLDRSHAFDIDIKPGTGPRHLCFSPDGRYAYLLGELNGEISVIEYSPESQSPFRIVQTVLADEAEGRGSADIHVSPDGRHLYASHRLKNDGISIFEIGENGMLTKVGYQNTGIHPRNFAITPSGRYVLVACRDSHRVEIYERDATTGLLKNTGRSIEMPSPVCVSTGNFRLLSLSFLNH